LPVGHYDADIIAAFGVDDNEQFVAERLTSVMKRGSVRECSWSGMVSDRGSPKMVVALSKATPCFARLDRALRESHSKVSGIKIQSVPDT